LKIIQFRRVRFLTRSLRVVQQHLALIIERLAAETCQVDLALQPIGYGSQLSLLQIAELSKKGQQRAYGLYLNNGGIQGGNN
jgi:hypothetical protein